MKLALIGLLHALRPRQGRFESDRGKKDATYTVTVLCAIDDKRRLVNGEWFGYAKEDNVTYPFVLQRGTTYFYGEFYEATTLGKKPIQLGGYFTIKAEDGSEEWVYEITHCHEY